MLTEENIWTGEISMKRLILIVGILALCLIGGYIFQENNQHLVSAGAKDKDQEIVEKNTVIKEVYSVNEEKENEKVQEENNQKENEIDNGIPIKEEGIKEHQSINSNPKYGTSSKKVFLTFDDGPTTLTPEVLRILEENNVNATFFVIGRLAEKNPDIIRESYLKGNMILTHTYSHDYAIYSTFDSFYEDFFKTQKIINNILNIKVPPIFRFPGGSSNQSSFKYGGKQFMPSLTEDIKEKGYYYIDWNVSSGDAGPDYNNKDIMTANVLDGSIGKDLAIVLFHDVPKNTKMIEILPKIISEFKERGYEFRTFRDITEEELDEMVTLKLSNKTIIR